RVGGLVVAQNVWSPVYVDALILRDQSTNGGVSLNQRLYVQQDANWNVTALVGATGNGVERYSYERYAQRTIFDASWNVRTSSNFIWVYLFQGKRLEIITGLYYFDERWYSVTLMRFLQQDPIGFGGGSNFYGMEGDGPTDATDPT